MGCLAEVRISPHPFQEGPWLQDPRGVDDAADGWERSGQGRQAVGEVVVRNVRQQRARWAEGVRGASVLKKNTCITKNLVAIG